jgi:hypothetical protein
MSEQSEQVELPSSAFFDLVSYLAAQRDWSTKTFGPGPRQRGIAEHVGKELVEVADACTPQEAMEEWCDIAILALDGAWRAGFIPEQVCEQLRRKAAINRARQWPPPGPEDRANEHVRPNATPECSAVVDILEKVVLPCPFCGSPASVNELDKCVECTGCTAMTYCQDTVQPAIEQWNRRQNANLTDTRSRRKTSMSEKVATAGTVKNAAGEYDTTQCHEATCPYCGYSELDSWELDFGDSMEGEIETDCSHCGETYICARTVTVTYDSKKKPNANLTD